MMMRCGLVVLGVVACASAPPRKTQVAKVQPVAPPVAAPPVAPEPIAPTPPAGQRLPHTFSPTSYRARLAVGERLTGHIEITGELREATSLIWLHGVGIEVSSATATRDGATVQLEVARTQQLLALQAKQPLAQGPWVVSLDYRAPIAPGSGMTVGAFRQVVDGAPYVFTQFEAMDARRVFPCIDEPDVKVPWQLTLDVGVGLVAVSNTAVVRSTPIDDGHVRVEFAPTLPLPSYLIAFAVGPFEIVDAGKARSGVPIRLLVERGASALAAGPARETAHIVDLLETWLAIPYAYGKLDLVAVPRLAPLTAMEHAGMITFDARLFTHEVPAEWVFVASHELAHQWFGDLVTMAWWDDIWLNEGFAAWMTDKLMAQLQPKGAAELHAAQERSQTLQVGLAIRAPLSAIDNSLQMLGYFDGTRGALLLRMIEKQIGPEVFMRAVRAYLKQHAQGSVVSADLVAAMTAASGRSLDNLFTEYLDRASLPELESELVCAAGRATLELTATADRTVPVCVAYDRDGKRAETCAIVTGGSLSVPLPAKACPRWVMPNVGSIGIYATTWTPAKVTALIDRGWKSLTPAERFTVLAEQPDHNATEHAVLLAIASRLVDAADPVSMTAGLRTLAADARYVPDDLRPQLAAWVEQHVGAAARAVHFKPPTTRPRSVGSSSSSSWSPRPVIHSSRARPASSPRTTRRSRRTSWRRRSPRRRTPIQSSRRTCSMTRSGSRAARRSSGSSRRSRTSTMSRA